MGGRSLRSPVRTIGMTAAALSLIVFAQGAASATSAVSATSSASGSSTCRSVDLPVPTGTTESAVYGGDPSGRYLVGVGFRSGGSDGLRWVGGRLRPIDQRPLEPYLQVQFNAVNSNGEIVGYRMTNASSFHTDAFIYRDGRFTLLPAPSPGYATEALAINARGDVVGIATGSDGQIPVEWSIGRHGAVVRVLATPSGDAAIASGIDTNGAVVGYLISPTATIPYVWPAHGTPHSLPVPPGSTYGVAYAVSGGMAVGDVIDPTTGTSELAEWNLRTGRLKTWPNVEGQALSINHQGTIGVAGGELVHRDGRIVPVTGWVYTVSDRGTAAGTTNFFTGRAVQWLGC